ncbi:hypothetical protein SAMN04487941_3399 [Pontibacter akesuensis]|uniref:Lipoprotein n=2 Tax=Pontibacter akesuensis TaxID=388950 RepID=A0A1I7K520_9BACT|nr:hypothetical protein SAMN04487941_3399 [Pontibacter akesuensis]
MRKLKNLVLVVMALTLVSSCTVSRKKPTSVGKVIIVKDAKKSSDNGLHKGWYKNPNNPHHPLTTNPGHTKQKGKAAKAAPKKAAPKKKTGKG